MLFNSYIFIFVFFPITFIGMFWIGKYSHRLAALWVGIASLVFYGAWDTEFVLLLLASICFNYASGYWICVQRGVSEAQSISATSPVKVTLTFAIIGNLSLLGYFKYANFFIDSANAFFDSPVPMLDIILPLGISFFTFTQIAFLVDTYRGLAKEFNFIHYLLFVTYFPHLIAGPVLHHKQMMPQFAKPDMYKINWNNVTVGAAIFIVGLAKKVLVADNLAVYATPIFSAAGDGSIIMFADAWIGSLAYTLQLYFDFSGYCDMAIGISLMLNVRLPLNFESPYKATSIIDFWRRWHMTLSAFLRDYLYIPLGGNRNGRARRYSNLMITMILGGLWHGAGWTFVVWGGLHGLYLMINHAWRGFKVKAGIGDGGLIGKVTSVLLTFLAVVVAWVFFRAEDFTSAINILAGMVGVNGLSPLSALVENVQAIGFILFGLFIVWFRPNTRQMFGKHKPTWEDMEGIRLEDAAAPTSEKAIWQPWTASTGNAVVYGLLFAICIMSLTQVSEFLYFQF